MQKFMILTPNEINPILLSLPVANQTQTKCLIPFLAVEWIGYSFIYLGDMCLILNSD